MTERYAYPAEFVRDADSGVVTLSFVDLPGVTEGRDRDEAARRGIDLLETALTEYISRRQPVPIPSRVRRGQLAVRPSALGLAKLALYEAMRDQGVGRAALARRLGWHLAQVDRILDLAHDSKMDLVEKALGALDLRLQVAVEAA